MQTLTTIAAERDLEEIVALVNSAYRGESSRSGWTSESHLLGGERITLSILREEMSSGRIVLLLRDPDSRGLLGCVSLEFYPGKDHCYLGMLTVRPTLQNQSLGKTLMVEAERFAKEKGASRMVLGLIQSRTELLEWYLRRGYRPNGETKPFPADAERFPRLTEEPLHFIFLEKGL